MANPWRIAAWGSCTTIVGWLLSPIITLLVNRLFSYLLDASLKIQELEIQLVPKLEQMLRKIEEERMHRKAKKDRSAVQDLDVMVKLDIIGDDDDEPHCSSNWHQHIDKAIHYCKTSSLGGWITNLLERAQSLYRSIHSRSAALLPISCSRCCGSASVYLPERLNCFSWHFDFVSGCQSLFTWTVNWIERDWFYDTIGITATGYQLEDGAAVYSFLPAIARWELRKGIEKIENTVTNVEKSPYLVETSSGSWNGIVNDHRRSITSTSTWKVFGRDRERNMVRNMLREGPDDSAASSSSRKCYSVICIHGIAGSGKITLAKYVCESEMEDKDKYFDTIMLIHVSKSYRREDVFRDMLQEITRSRHSEINDCKGLEENLVENLRGKRFLLVLDDLWVNDENHEKLLSPLNAGKAGSKILVTTQSKEAALGSNRLIAISDMEEEQYFSLFMHYALNSSILDDQEYIQIGRKIAKKLNRSPIAAVTVAGHLWRNPDIRYWQTTSNLDVLNKTKGALWWSYNQLLVDVRRCFQYCSIFPRSTRIREGQRWKKEDVEDVGEDYFHDLHSCSFLQLKRKAPSDISTGEYFTVHDMFHELAMTIAGSDCVKIEKSITERLPKHVRHLCIESYSEILFLEKILELKNLRTLIMCYSVEGMNPDDFERVLKKLTKLRVVDLDLGYLRRVPPCIGRLKHLRYLGIMSAPPHSFTLPAEFSKLYHLQELSVPPNTRLHCPSELKIANLINLRYMMTWYGLNIPDVGKLTSLRALYHFYVRKEKGYEIQQLEHLNKLRGKLFIECIENVQSKEEAFQARLSDKVYLSELTLRWGGTDERCSKKAIEEYRGLRYPSWLTGEGHKKDEKDVHPALQNLMFWSCKGSNDPPKIGEHFTCLHTLSIADCSWNSLPANLYRMKTLKELIVQECPNIMSLPKLPQSLKSIVIADCNPFLAKSCQNPRHQNWGKIAHIDQQIIR
uniref:Uncharacterized protein n=1 Tax=Leersia perrieri TaxID=77586 RepID=A0A0D9XVC2_9ORYZ